MITYVILLKNIKQCPGQVKHVKAMKVILLYFLFILTRETFDAWSAICLGHNCPINNPCMSA